MVADRLHKLAAVAPDLKAALPHVHVLDLAGWPLYGPVDEADAKRRNYRLHNADAPLSQYSQPTQ